MVALEREGGIGREGYFLSLAVKVVSISSSSVGRLSPWKGSNW